MATQTLADALAVVDHMRHETLYGCDNWKGGVGIYEINTPAYLVPDSTYDNLKPGISASWVVPFSSDTDTFNLRLIGKAFLHRVRFVNTATVDHRAITSDIEVFLEIFPEQKMVWSNTDVGAGKILDSGFWYVNWHFDPKDRTSENTVRSVPEEEYRSVKKISADFLSETISLSVNKKADEDNMFSVARPPVQPSALLW